MAMKIKVYTVCHSKKSPLKLFKATHVYICILFNGQDVCMQVGPSYKFISKNNKEISAKNLNYFTPSLLPPRQTNISFYLLEKKCCSFMLYAVKS